MTLAKPMGLLGMHFDKTKEDTPTRVTLPSTRAVTGPARSKNLSRITNAQMFLKMFDVAGAGRHTQLVIIYIHTKLKIL